jgi:hypothetical protein
LTRRSSFSTQMPLLNSLAFLNKERGGAGMQTDLVVDGDLLSIHNAALLFHTIRVLQSFARKPLSTHILTAFVRTVNGVFHKHLRKYQGCDNFFGFSHHTCPECAQFVCAFCAAVDGGDCRMQGNGAGGRYPGSGALRPEAQRGRRVPPRRTAASPQKSGAAARPPCPAPTHSSKPAKKRRRSGDLRCGAGKSRDQ